MSFKSRVAHVLGVGALALSLVLSTTGVVAAAVDPQSTNPDQAVQVPVGGRLTGSLAGAPAGGWAGSANRFAYYKFKYDGNNRVVTINMQIYPDDETIVDQGGFVLYGPKTVGNPNFTYVVGGAQPKQMPNVSGNLISMDAGDYLIQVYNDSTTTVNFALWADNLPIQPVPAPSQGTVAAPAAPVIPAPAPAPAPVVAPPAAPAPAPAVAPPAAPAAAPASPTDHTVKNSNSFTGDLAPGKSDMFQFDYPGDESVYTINVQMYPDDGAILQNAGFQVFKPNGDLQVKGGAQPKLQPNMSANVISKTPGTYSVKLYNDQPNTVVVNYTVTLVTGKPEGR